MNSRVLILSFSPIASDPRVLRQIAALAQRFSVTVAGFGKPPPLGVAFISLDNPRSLRHRAAKGLHLLAGRFEQHYWSDATVRSALSALQGKSFDLIVANEIHAVPLAERLSSGTAAILLDAHEFSPLEAEESVVWNLFFKRHACYLCKEYIPRVDAMITVGEEIAQEYHRRYGQPCSVVRNAPHFADLTPRATDPRSIRLIHHGNGGPSRRIEDMMEVARHLDQRFHVTFMLMPVNRGYHDRLRRLADTLSNVSVVAPVSTDDIVATIAEHDLGLYLLPMTNFNNINALPNKLFEFVQARLGVAIGPSPAMARVVREYGLGVVAEHNTPQSLAATLNSCTASDVDAWKAASHRAARALSFESTEAVLLEACDQALARKRRRN